MITTLPRIFFGGTEEDTGHMRILWDRHEVVAPLLCAKVEELTTDLPLTHKAMEFMLWKEHGCRWTESLMTGVVGADLKRLIAAVMDALSRGPVKAKLFPQDVIQIGEDGRAWRNHRLTKIMQPLPGDRRKAAYTFLLGDGPFCPPSGRVRQLPSWNPFDDLASSL